MNSYICCNCNKSFERKYSKNTLKTRKNFFCSKECNNTFNQIKTNCKHCDNIFTHPKSRERKFCSRSCSVSYNNITNKIYKCKYCETIISIGYTDGRITCDSCYNSSIYDNMTLFELKEKYLNCPSNYHSVIRAHSRRIFKSNAKLMECKICGYKNHVNICHIKAVKNFPKNTLISEVNDIKNLVALCPNHHWEFDHSLIKF